MRAYINRRTVTRGWMAREEGTFLTLESEPQDDFYSSKEIEMQDEHLGYIEVDDLDFVTYMEPSVVIDGEYYLIKRIEGNKAILSMIAAVEIEISLPIHKEHPDA